MFGLAVTSRARVTRGTISYLPREAVRLAVTLEGVFYTANRH